MRLAERVEAIYRDFPTDWSLRVLQSLCAFDRYQASEGIERAADCVAAAAEEAGLREVSITSFDVSEGIKWWSFDSPRPWTPVNASLQLGAQTVVRFPQDRLCLATYSAACAASTELPLVWMDTVAVAEARGAVAVLSPSVRNIGEACDAVERAELQARVDGSPGPR
jgi:hypothetical protein